MLRVCPSRSVSCAAAGARKCGCCNLNDLHNVVSAVDVSDGDEEGACPCAGGSGYDDGGSVDTNDQLMSVCKSTGAQAPPGCSACTKLRSKNLRATVGDMAYNQRQLARAWHWHGTGMALAELTRCVCRRCTLSFHPRCVRPPLARKPRCCVRRSQQPRTGQSLMKEAVKAGYAPVLQTKARGREGVAVASWQQQQQG